MNIEHYTRTVHHGYIDLLGHRFDLIDFMNVLHELKEESNIVVTSTNMATVLKTLKVIGNEGNYRHHIPASKGENFDFFYEFMKTKVKEVTNYILMEENIICYS